MSKYKGLFTYDIDNHRYIPVEQAEGIISDMNWVPEVNLLKNADTIEDFERAIEEARHYILMDTDTFTVCVGDIEIRRVK